MKNKKQLAVSVSLNIGLVLLLAVAVLEAQRNRNLYIDEEARNSLLTMELNERNSIIQELEKDLKKFDAEYTR